MTFVITTIEVVIHIHDLMLAIQLVCLCTDKNNVLINDWYACLHVLSKQLAVWNAQFVCWAIT